MRDEIFEAIIDEALDGLPKEFAERLDNVSIVLSDWPTNEDLSVLRSRGEGGMLLGLYHGIPQTRRRNYGVGGTMPDKITIFKNPLLMVSRTKGELIKNIKDTVIHEIAHHFGMSDDEIKTAKKSVR